MLKQKLLIIFFGITLSLQPLHLQANFYSSFLATTKWVSNTIQEHKIVTAALATVACTLVGLKFYQLYSNRQKSKLIALKSKRSQKGKEVDDSSTEICKYDHENLEHAQCMNELCEKNYYMLWTVAPKNASIRVAEEYINKCKNLFRDSAFKYIIMKDNDPAGFIAYAEGHINLLAVKEKYRGQGLGNALIGHAINDLEGQGCKKIWLYVRNTNINAQNQYKKFGFTNKPTSNNPIVMTRYSKHQN